MLMVSTDAGHRPDTAREPIPPNLLLAIDRLQSRHLAAADSQDLFDTLLGDLLELTRSGDGVLVELVPLTGGQLAPRQRVYQMLREAGDTVHDDSHPQSESRGFEALLSAALGAGRAVFDPAEPPAASPEFETRDVRVALPLTHGERVVAVVGLGGRRGGYDQALLGQLRPLLQAGATVIAARQAELELRDRNALLQQTWERLLLLLNTVPHGVGEVDVGGTVVQANAALHRLLGYGEGELVGRRVWERRGGDEPGEFLHACHELLIRERPEPGLLFFRERARDGRVLDLRLDWDYRLDQSGAACGLVVVVTDMTDRRRAEAAFQEIQGHLERRVQERTALLTREIGQRKQAEQLLRESEEHYRLLAENSTDMISQHDAAAIYQYVSPSCRSLLGYEPDELLGRDPYDLYHPDDVAAVRATHEQILRGPGVAAVEYRMRRRDGTYAWLETTCKAVRDPSTGAVREIIAVSRDVTHRRQVERALRESEARAVAVEERRQMEVQIQQALRQESLGVLAGGVAHEFNNLLTGILGYTDLAVAQLDATHPARAQLIEALTGTRRAAELTRQLLAYSGHGRFVVGPLRLDEVVRSVDQLLKVSLSRKCKIEFFLEGSLPPVEGDPTQIRQLLMNLALNASEAIGEGSGVITLRAGTCLCDRDYLTGCQGNGGLVEGTYVYLEVEDTGSGMTPEVQARMFDPFFTTKFTGRGLGLAAVLGIVRGHKGAVRVTSAPGRGTTVRVLFPASGAPVSAQERPAERQDSAWRGEGVVLIVDDEKHVRELARYLLERAGFTVLTAADGQQALEVYRAGLGRIDVVLLDLNMPRLNGTEVFRAIRRMRPDARVVLTSGYGEQESAEQLTAEGLAGFLPKPYRVNDLLQALRKALGR